MTKIKKEKQNLLQQIWGRTEEAWDEIKQKRASKSLRVQAEQDLLEIQDEQIKLQEDLEKAIEESKDSKDWKSIRKIALSKDIKAKELDKASELYEEFFDKKASEILED